LIVEAEIIHKQAQPAYENGIRHTVAMGGPVSFGSAILAVFDQLVDHFGLGQG